MWVFLLQFLLLQVPLEERDDKDKPEEGGVSGLLNSCAWLGALLEPGRAPQAAVTCNFHYQVDTGSSPAAESARISKPEGRTVHL